MSANIFFSSYVFMLFCRHVVRLHYESFEISQESLVWKKLGECEVVSKAVYMTPLKKQNSK